MSFTNPTLIRTHLLTSTFPEQVIRNYSVTFDEQSQITLPHHSLVTDSDVVKLDSHMAPVLDDTATVKAEDWVDLTHTQLVPGTVLVTLRETLATIYTEEVDYQMDYAGGRIRRLASGTIPDNQPLVLFYAHYSLFTNGSDYEVDYPSGIITRVTEGAIPDGASVFVDYAVAAGAVEDDLITQAIVEAEDIVVRLLAPEYNSSSTDQGLKTGATKLALSIICRALAIEALSRRTTTDIPGRAKEWQQLSRSYEEQAWSTLAPFLLPMTMRSTALNRRESAL